MVKRNLALVTSQGADKNSGVYMTRQEQNQINSKVINRIIDCMAANPRPWHVPSYKALIALLKNEGLKNSRGEVWKMKTLYEMLSRNGYRGLHGLKCAYLAGEFGGDDSSISRGQ
jgi:hypothetical protein